MTICQTMTFVCGVTILQIQHKIDFHLQQLHSSEPPSRKVNLSQSCINITYLNWVAILICQWFKSTKISTLLKYPSNARTIQTIGCVSGVYCCVYHLVTSITKYGTGRLLILYSTLGHRFKQVQKLIAETCSRNSQKQTREEP